MRVSEVPSVLGSMRRSVINRMPALASLSLVWRIEKALRNAQTGYTLHGELSSMPKKWGNASPITRKTVVDVA